MKSIAFSLVGLLFASSLYAATVIPSDGVEILFVDGTEIEEQREPITLSPTSTQLIIKFSHKFGKNNNRKVYDSAPYVVYLDIPDVNVEINAPKVYTYEQANKQFKSTPNWSISTSDGVILDYKQERLPSSDGFLPYYDMESLVKKYNDAKGISFGAETALVASVVSEKASEQVASLEVSTSNLEQLQAWYRKTSKQERKAFRKWMIDQE